MREMTRVVPGKSRMRAAMARTAEKMAHRSTLLDRTKFWNSTCSHSHSHNPRGGEDKVRVGAWARSLWERAGRALDYPNRRM